MKAWHIGLGIALLALLGAVWAVTAPKKASVPQTRNVVCTTFPIYQLTRNLTVGCDGLVVEQLLPAALGCPHDYSLTPQDMQKLAKADLLVVNGLGMESFLGAPLTQANPTLRVLDSAAGATDLIMETHACSHDHHNHDHDDQPNPHLFVSPRRQAEMARRLATRLAERYPDAAPRLLANGESYARRLEQLGERFRDLGARVKNNRIAQPHGAFDYLAKDAGLQIVATLQEDGQDPGAADLLRLVALLKKEGAGGIFAEPQYPAKVLQLLSRETGVPFATLDPCASGPHAAPLDYYEQRMEENLRLLQEVLR